MLKKGDTCPCCGKPIKTDDPRALMILTEIAEFLKEREGNNEGRDDREGEGT